jgi:hypothetical protein
MCSGKEAIRCRNRASTPQPWIRSQLASVRDPGVGDRSWPWHAPGTRTWIALPSIEVRRGLQKRKAGKIEIFWPLTNGRRHPREGKRQHHALHYASRFMLAGNDSRTQEGELSSVPGNSPRSPTDLLPAADLRARFAHLALSAPRSHRQVSGVFLCADKKCDSWPDEGCTRTCAYLMCLRCPLHVRRPS